MPMSEATLAEKALIDWTTDDDLLFYERPPREACSLCSDTVGTAADASSVNVIVRLQCCAAAVCRRCISNGLLPLYSACCPFCEKKLAPIDRIAGCTHDEDWIAMEKQEFFQNLLRDGFEGFRCTSESCVKGCLARAQNPQAALCAECNLPHCARCGCRWPSDGNHECEDLVAQRQRQKDREFKLCPGCFHPSQLLTGCNIVRCTVSACHLEWCFSCGKALSQSHCGHFQCSSSTRSTCIFR